MNIDKQSTSVIIIGAGPAGAATSFFLSKYKIHHIVIEKDIFPRDKVCGDACSGKTALVINKANPEWLNEILADSKTFMPSWGIKFVAPNGKPLNIPFNPNRQPDSKAPGFTVPRLIFDNFLFKKMVSPFCTVYQNAVVKSISNVQNSVTVELNYNNCDVTITAPLLVGADGDKSIVRKTFFESTTSPKTYAIGLRAYFEGVTDLHNDNFIELHFLKEVLPGYLWVFPMPNGRVNVGVGILSEVVRKKKINLRQSMLDAITNNEQISYRFKNAKQLGNIQGWGLPLGTNRQPISSNNILLTGDAAHLVDPFSGEGIGNAMYSGMLAAAAIKESIDNSNYREDFLKSVYDDVFYKRIGQELKLSTTMQRMCNYHWLFNFVVNKAHKSETLRNTISGMFTDMDLRSKLSKPSFYIKLLLNM